MRNLRGYDSHVFLNLALKITNHNPPRPLFARVSSWFIERVGIIQQALFSQRDLPNSASKCKIIPKEFRCVLGMP